MNMNSYDCCTTKTSENDKILSQLSLLKLLADKNRLQILCVLGSDIHTVGEITGHLGQSQSLVSHHLISLKKLTLITFQKNGREVFYSLSTKGKIVLKLLKILSKNHR